MIFFSAMALRYDVQAFEAEKITRTPQGGIVIPAAVSRTGALGYVLADGSVRREYRPPDEVFSADSLKTLRAVAVTNRHPDQPVTAQNFKELSIGHVDGPARTTEQFVEADLAIDDAPLVQDVERGDLKEVSAGYSVDLDETPGVTPDGIKYDAIQRNIRFNHVALGPPGWGRSGPEVSLRVDSKDAKCSPLHGGEAQDKKDEIMKMIKIDGVDFEFGSEAHLSKERELAQARLDMSEGKAKEDMGAMQKKYDELKAKYDALKADMEKKNKADMEEEEKKDSLFAERVAARVALETRAKSLASDLKLDGKSDREVMIETIKSIDEEFSAEDRSDDYVTAIFDTLKAKSSSGMDQVFHGDGKGDNVRADSVDEARKRMEERAASAWKGDAK